MKITNFYKGLFAVLFVAAIVSFSSTGAKAQEISGGLELALPGGDLSDAVGTGIGISGRYEQGFGDKMSWLVDAGFISFAGKNSAPSVTTIPVQGGVKYYFQEQMKGFYGLAEIGFHSSSGGGYSATNLSYAPAIGYHLEKFDLGLKYQVINVSQGSASYIGIRVAYIFSG